MVELVGLEPTNLLIAGQMLSQTELQPHILVDLEGSAPSFSD